MKKLKVISAGFAAVFLICGCTNDAASDRGSIANRQEPSPAAAAVTVTPTPEPAPAEVTPAVAEETPAIFEEMADWQFIFSSGAGGWETELFVEPDGSFYGEYYDYDMGDTGPGYSEHGTKYECRFKGSFSSCEEIDTDTYAVTIGEINYENAPGTEEVKDGTRFIYTNAYGIGEQTDFLVYAPGAEFKELPEDYIGWISYTHYSANANGLWGKSYPEELPFCGFYNPWDDCGFFSVNRSDKNKTFLVNSVSLPGLKNTKAVMNDDQTYEYEDMDDGACIVIRNICFEANKDYMSLTSNEEDFADICLKKLGADPADGDLFLFGYNDRDNALASSHVQVNGYNSVYAVWYQGKNEDTRLHMAVFTQLTGNYNPAQDAYDPGYIYIYEINISEDHSIYDYDTLSLYLDSLDFSGSPYRLSSSSIYELPQDARWFEAKASKKDNIMELKEVMAISIDDEDRLNAYGIKKDDIMGDYAYVEIDTDFTEYEMIEDCPIYYVYMENVFTQPLDFYEYRDATEDDPDGGIVMVYLDRNGKIVMIASPDIF